MPPELARIPCGLRPRRTTGLVRLGDVHDGGYVVSEDALGAADFLVSLGVSTNWEFEKAFLAERHARRGALTIHVYDHSVDARYLRTYRLKALARFLLARDKKYLAQWRQAAHFTQFFDGLTAT